jgi:hypothetical protein
MSFRTFTARSLGVATARAAAGSARRFPRHGVAGLVMMLVGWVSAWMPTHPLSAGSFILLWVGFIFAVDELVLWRRGTSLWQAHRWKFVQLFLFSIPVWWLFEWLNLRVQNWHYIVDHPYGYTWTPLTYNLMATVCFSTVLPAVMEVASLLTSFAPLRPRLAAREAEPAIPASQLALEFGGGILMILAALIWPRVAFGLIWLGPLLFLDAINAANRRRSAIGHLAAGDWRFVVTLALAALVCGFFWEMWNFWSLPKWYYTIPYVGFAKIFEMPVLGFSGYLPFGVELFALYQTLLWLTRQRDDALPF